ncbi:hypothetical protein [Luteolibacter sp. Populi]|uniref:hypothetical protein n=1 Tax=Luteolibacter sp. Populi TaxID=3230487 RepID=UPI003465A7BB
MKLSQSAFLGLVAIVSTGAANAQITIRFAASNGDRNATQVAISKVLTNWSYQGLGGVATGLGGSGQAPSDTFRTSNFGTWNGTYDGKNVIIKTNFAGALAGIAAVANPDSVVRFDPSNGLGGTQITVNPLEATLPGDFSTGKVDFGLSTNFQSTSPFSGTYENIPYNTVKEIPVGISQLGFYGSPGIPIDSITTQQARLLYDTGAIPLALITGNWAADAKKYIYALGRNTDAGQRFSAQNEIGRDGLGSQGAWEPTPAPSAGGAANAPLVADPANPGQFITNGAYDPTKSFVIGSSSPLGGIVSDHRVWNGGVPQTISGIRSTQGYNSGANIAIALTYKLGEAAYKKVDPAATAGWYVGYITPGDANVTVLGNGQGVQRPADSKGVALKFNGVENTAANVKSGRYTLWLYNRIITPLDGVADKEDPGETEGFRQNFVNSLRDQIKLEVSTQQGISLTDPDLKVFRTEDGGPVIPGTLPTGD